MSSVTSSDGAANVIAVSVAPAPSAAKLTDSTMGEVAAAEVVSDSPSGAIQDAPAEPAKSEAEQRVAAKFAALTRKEKSIKTEERRVAAMRKEIEAQKAAMSTAGVDGTKYISLEDFNKNPYKYLKDNNHSLESIAEVVMNDGKLTPEKIAAQVRSELQAEIDAMKKQLADKDEATAAEKMDTVLANFKTQLGGFVEATPDYEMIRADGAEGVQLVYDVIDTYFNEQLEAYKAENGESAPQEELKNFILSNKQACDMVEKHLLDQEKARIERARKLTKTKGLFEPSVPTKVEPKVSSSATNTLTNTLSTQVPSSSKKMLTDDESKREAAKLIKFID